MPIPRRTRLLVYLNLLPIMKTNKDGGWNRRPNKYTAAMRKEQAEIALRTLALEAKLADEIERINQEIEQSQYELGQLLGGN